MAITQYDDPRWNPNPMANDRPVFRSLTDVQDTSQPTTQEWPRSPLGTSEGSGGGGGIPLGWLKAIPSLLGKLFGHGGSSTPTTTTPKPNAPTSTAPSTTQSLVGMAPELIQLILALRANSQANNPANNPALASLNASVPQLTQQLNALLQNDVQRRQQSDPLYQAVLRGAMGGLPVWMRGGMAGMTGGGGGLTGPTAPPRVPTSGVPMTPGTDLFRAQGDDGSGTGYPHG